MSLIFLLLLVILIYFISSLILKRNIYDLFQSNISVVILGGIFVSILVTFIHPGHPYDLGCFDSWSRLLFENGLSKFYVSEGFTDYPPGYMYILYFLGAVRALFEKFSIRYNYILLLKFPAIVANILTGIFIYSIAIKKMSERKAITFCLFYVFNPMVLFNSSIWGQVDSIHTFIIILAIYFMIEKKLLLSSLVFTTSAIIKPQTLMFSPLYLFVFFMNLREETFGFKAYIADKKKRYFNVFDFLKSGKSFFKLLWRYFRYLFLCFALLVFMSLFFADTSSGAYDFTPIIKQYINTLSSYDYATVNASNFYGLLGMNWYDASKMILSLTISQWSTCVILPMIVLFSFYLLWRSRTKSNFYFTAAVINMCVFMISVKMHERYAFPIIGLLLMAYLYKNDKRILYLFFSVTGVVLANCFDVLRATLHESDWSMLDVSIRVISLIAVVVFIYMLVMIFKIYPYSGRGEGQFELITDDVPEEKKLNLTESADIMDSEEGLAEDSEESETDDLPKKRETFKFEVSQKLAKMHKNDYILMISVMLIYAIIAFINLGNTTSPQSPWVSNENKEVLVDLGNEYEIKKAHWFLGVQHDRDFTISTSVDNVTWNSPKEIKSASVFSWSKIDIKENARYIKVETQCSDLMIMEMGFEDDTGSAVPISSSNVSELFDEQQFVPVGFQEQEGTNLYMTGTYFDEIYHARTGYEFLHKLPAYEWTHPPLGKAIISIGIAIFGMTPFGWRFSGTLVGVLMLPLIYLFAKKLSGKTFWAFFTTFIFAFDFMHYVQTRIATIDTYITFFVIAMFYFMYIYWNMSFYDTPFAKTLIPLSLSGICMGLGIACKWPGVYAGVGLGVIFFIVLWKRFVEYRYAKAHDMEDITAKFPKYTVWTLLCCVGFFIIIPVIIYLLSYIPFYATESLYPNRDNISFIRDSQIWAALLPDNAFGNYIAAIVQNQIDIFRYHSTLVSEHPYSSPWFSWPFIIKPIYYYSHTYSDTIKAGISSFGNPAVWWTGIVAVIYGIVQCSRDDGTNKKMWLFLIIGYFAQYVFWVPVTRTTYIYHYFPCVPFLALLLAGMFRDVSLSRYGFKPAYIFLGVTLLLFIMYYPVLTGIGVYAPYVKYVLKLFMKQWVLIS